MKNEKGTGKHHEATSFMFQIEPAISFAKIDGNSSHYDASVAGGNLSFLIMPSGISNVPVSTDSTIRFENRIRITMGYWHLIRLVDIIPLRAGFDLAIKKKLGEALYIIPHVGFQYGICFGLNRYMDVVNRMYNFRFGVDFNPGTNALRVGVAYTINRVIINLDDYNFSWSGKLKYNQLALNISI